MRLGLLSAACAAAILSLPVAASAADGAAPLLGFTPGSSAAERALEARFDRNLSAEDERDLLKTFSAEPNEVGSPHDRANAERMLALFRGWGWDARIETFMVLYPTPLEEKLELLGPAPFTAALHEPPVAGDLSSTQTANVLPPYLAYQGDGDVTAEVVYANYGMPDDYRVLERAGVDVRGKIVLTRYGGGWRGLKPKLAQEHGAVGCLIYSDPADDGYGVAPPYPAGGSRPPEGVQRGSVQDITSYSGDPLTPGVGSVPGAHRLERSEAKTLMRIPALPISYADALPFLRALTGPTAPKSFRGQLPVTYRFGPTEAKAHLLVRSDWSQKPVYDVIATLKGSEDPDAWVVRGNHHDGWVFGAWDPLAGNSALLEEAKSIGALLKTGWRPKRTIIYASWDGEEPGLIGSTEWAETHAAELQQKGVVYINTDENARGFLEAGASHDLQHLINEAALDVTDPETHGSVQARARALVLTRAQSDPKLEGEARMAAAGVDPVSALGSGSDYTAFLQHLGLASINLGYGGEDQQAGVYHSLYDTFEHFSRFGDPTFAYGVALSETAGRLVLREADADILPLKFDGFADAVGVYVEEIKKLDAEERRREAATARLIAERAYQQTSDPETPTGPPASEPAGPPLDFTALETAVARLKTTAGAYDAALTARGPLPEERVRRLNAILGHVDQKLLDPEGLPGRPWYKNLAYAPGVLTGYGAKTLPGVREAVESHRWAEAQTEIGRTAAALNAYASEVEAAARVLTGG